MVNKWIEYWNHTNDISTETWKTISRENTLQTKKMMTKIKQIVEDKFLYCGNKWKIEDLKMEISFEYHPLHSKY